MLTVYPLYMGRLAHKSVESQESATYETSPNSETGNVRHPAQGPGLSTFMTLISHHGSRVIDQQ